MENLPVNKWAEDDRPYNKLVIKGRHTLSDAELLSILIAGDSLDMARNMLSKSNNSLYEFGKLSIHDLVKYKGMGEAKAVRIVAAFELGRRRKIEPAADKQRIHTSRDVQDILHPIIADLLHEEFWILFLNRANVVTAKRQVSSGGMVGTIVDPKMIFRAALEEKAVSIVLSHNHPSGNEKPSQQDIELTKKIVSAGKVLEISVLDHVIVTAHNYFSFANEGLM